MIKRFSDPATVLREFMKNAPGAYRGGFPGVSGNPFGFYTPIETLRN